MLFQGNYFRKHLAATPIKWSLIFILCILWVHIPTLPPLYREQSLGLLIRIGYLGSDGILILCGYAISYSFLKTKPNFKNYLKFLCSESLAIYLPYVFFLSLLLIYYFYKGIPWTMSDKLNYFFCLQNYQSHSWLQDKTLEHCWLVSSIVQIYLFYCILYPILQSKNQLLYFITIIIFINIYKFLHFDDTPIEALRKQSIYRIDSALLGSLIAFLQFHYKPNGSLLLKFFAISICCFSCILLYTESHMIYLYFICPPLLSFVIFLFPQNPLYNNQCKSHQLISYYFFQLFLCHFFVRYAIIPFILSKFQLNYVLILLTYLLFSSILAAILTFPYWFYQNHSKRETKHSENERTLI